MAETKRRNTSLNAYVELENILNMLWKKRNGIIRLPEIIIDLPRYLKLEIKQDLVWPVFYHSPHITEIVDSFETYDLRCNSARLQITR